MAVAVKGTSMQNLMEIYPEAGELQHGRGIVNTGRTAGQTPDTVSTYFMAMQGTVNLLSRGSGEDLGNCCKRPKAEDNSFPDLLHY